MIKINLKKYKNKISYLYCKEGLSLKKVAERIGVSAGLIRKKMILWGIPRRRSRKRDLIKPTKEKLKDLYEDQCLSINEITKRLDVGITTLFRWLNEYKIIPLKRFKYKKYNFSGDPKEKAYILGLVVGDLYVRQHCRQISVELSTTHPTMAELFHSIFQKYGKVKEYLKYNKITKRYGWRLYVLLDNSFSFMLAKDLDIDNEYFYDFLAGFFDSEGCLHIYNNHNYVGLTALICNSNKRLLKIIKGRLERDGLHPKFSKTFRKGEETTNNYFRGMNLWTIRLHTNKEVLSLMNSMPIKHQEKLEKLKIAKLPNKNKWVEISKEVLKLRSKIKENVEKFIDPLNLESK